MGTTADGAIEAHEVRTRQAGRMMFVDFHLIVPSNMSVAAAHDICDRLERAIKAEFPDAIILVHIEPDDEAKHSGIVVL
jgi:divalent metal cation (Fe/Co/Zn/Cd) transporter